VRFIRLSFRQYFIERLFNAVNAIYNNKSTINYNVSPIIQSLEGGNWEWKILPYCPGLGSLRHLMIPGDILLLGCPIKIDRVSGKISKCLYNTSSGFLVIL